MIMQKHMKIIGPICIIFFMLISGFQATFLSDLLQNVNIYAALFISFSITIIFFLVIHVCSKKNKAMIRRGGLDILYINLTTLGNWFSFFLAIKYLEPAIVASVANAVNPLLTLFIVIYILKSERLCGKEYSLIAGIILCTLGLAVVSYIGYSGVGDIELSHFFIGFIMSAICGISVVLHTVVSKRLDAKGIEPQQIMAIRFILLTIVAYFFVSHELIIESLSNYWQPILFITILGNIIGIYFLQLGIKMTSMLLVSYLHTAKPAIYFAMGMLSTHIHFSLVTLVLVSTTVFLLICTIYLKKVKNKKNTL